ncbi:hypothetical protein [Pannonibacter indicus]|uniref:Uncharacterized protein n=1 Tax=Pannonibacter indicus TaxID=466044 RepID=A0A0K6HMC8_9HYPH|nr:hypothetical protein [Pannonibacter indicus]CUA91953.1 hypothetical protein Ga0061067_101192 [Pannonibacter indicus]
MMSIGPSGIQSPQQYFQSKLTEQVSSGEITSSDMDAMLSALEAIDSEMGPGGSAPSAPPSREEMQTKLESLLSEQVEAGTLTQDQADELASLFESGEMAPPPPPGGGGGMPPMTEDDDTTEDILAQLLEELQTKTGYSASGTNTVASSTSLIVDYTA